MVLQALDCEVLQGVGLAQLLDVGCPTFHFAPWCHLGGVAAAAPQDGKGEGPLLEHGVEDEVTEREAVQTGVVGGLVGECLGRHVRRGARTLGHGGGNLGGV